MNTWEGSGNLDKPSTLVVSHIPRRSLMSAAKVTKETPEFDLSAAIIAVEEFGRQIVLLNELPAEKKREVLRDVDFVSARTQLGGALCALSQDFTDQRWQLNTFWWGGESHTPRLDEVHNAANPNVTGNCDTRDVELVHSIFERAGVPHNMTCDVLMHLFAGASLLFLANPAKMVNPSWKASSGSK